MKQLILFGIILSVCTVGLIAQTVPPNGVTIEVGGDAPTSTQYHVKTTVKIEGSPYDSAVFDSVHKVPFKIHEWRGEEMIHNWVSLGCPRAPHIYLGAGFYRFDKSGMSDIQIGAFPVNYPRIWEWYFSASHMFFLKKTSKMIDLPVCVDEDYLPNAVRHYQYVPKLRRDKFYGITVGFAYEGVPNLRNKTLYLYRMTDAAGEEHDIILKEFRQLSVSAGLSRMRCKNVEYEAPFRRKGKFRASSMSRLTIGGSYYPVNDVQVLMDPGFTVDFMNRAAQPDFSAFISWEGRTAFLNLKRECGLHMNFVLTYPTWNRVNDMPISFVNTWGVYFSLDKKQPKWRERL